MQEKSVFAQTLQRLRKQWELTQEELALRVGISYGAIVDYENARREPNCKALVALERFFGVSGAYLVGAEDGAAPASKEEAERPWERMERYHGVYAPTTRVEADHPAGAEGDIGCEPADYIVGVDISGDGVGLSVLCEGCGEVLLTGVFEHGSGVGLRIPQRCPKCGGKSNE